MKERVKWRLTHWRLSIGRRRSSSWPLRIAQKERDQGDSWLSTAIALSGLFVPLLKYFKHETGCSCLEHLHLHHLPPSFLDHKPSGLGLTTTKPPPLGPPSEVHSSALLLELRYTEQRLAHTKPASFAMARYSRDQRRRSTPSTSPWMTMFYICALVLAPMLFMGMIPTANAQEDAKDTSDIGPGKSPRVVLSGARNQRRQEDRAMFQWRALLTLSCSHRHRSWNNLLLRWYHEGWQGRDSCQRPG